MGSPTKITVINRSSIGNITIKPARRINVTAITGGGAGTGAGLDNSKVMKTGDTMTGTLNVPTVNFDKAEILTGNFVTTNTSEIIVNTFAISQFRSSKYIIQASSGTSHSTTELIVLHDNSDVYISEYGQVDTDDSLVSYTADISGINVRLKGTPVNATTTINFLRYSIKV